MLHYPAVVADQSIITTYHSCAVCCAHSLSLYFFAAGITWSSDYFFFYIFFLMRLEFGFSIYSVSAGFVEAVVMNA